MPRQCRALAVMEPGVSGDEVARAASEGIRLDRSEPFFHGVAAYSIGLGSPQNWGDHCISAVRGEETLLEAVMPFHLPIAMQNLGNSCVGFFETVVDTEDGCEQVTQLERQLFRCWEVGYDRNLRSRVGQEISEAARREE